MLAYLIAGVAALALLAGIGYKVRESGKDEIRLEWAQANEAARKREQEASAAAAAALEAERKKRRVVIREVTNYVDKIIDRPVYRNVCLDPDGLRCVNAAILGTDSTGCKPDSALPAPKPAG